MINTPIFYGLTGSKGNSNIVIGLIAISIVGFAFYHFYKAKPVAKPKPLTGPPTIETIQNLKK